MTRVGLKPFQFSERHRDNLLTIWKTPEARQQATAYLRAIEPRIALWIGFAENRGHSHGEIKDALIKLSSKLSACRNYLKDHPEAGYALTQASTVPENTLIHALDQFSELSALLEAAAQDVAQAIPVSRGPDVSLEVWLVSMLADLWEGAFNKPVTKHGKFRIFIERLYWILGYEIGPSAINKALDNRTTSFLPPI